MTQTCSACGGAFHPATGHAWTPTLVLCHRCALSWIAWLRKRDAQFNRPWRRPDSQQSFVSAALTSVRPS